MLKPEIHVQSNWLVLATLFKWTTAIGGLTEDDFQFCFEAFYIWNCEIHFSVNCWMDFNDGQDWVCDLPFQYNGSIQNIYAHI